MNSKLIKCSVIMSCYNEPLKYFKKAVESILDQSFEYFEFIIILDNTENKILEKEILKYKKKDKRIVFIKNKKNLGLASSLNKGIKLSNGKYIVRMDADDISKKNRLKIQYDYMEKNKNIDLLFSEVEYIDENSNFIKYFKPEKYKVQNLKKYFFKEHLLVHPSLFCKSKISKENLFNITQLRSQDFELWIRLISKNYKFDLINKNLLSYRILNQKNLEKRIKKVKNSNYYGLMALNNNLKNLLRFNNIFSFYLFFLISRVFFIIFPIKLIKYIVLIIDRLKKNG